MPIHTSLHYGFYNSQLNDSITAKWSFSRFRKHKEDKENREKSFAVLSIHDFASFRLSAIVFYEVFGEMAFMTNKKETTEEKFFHEQFRCR